MSAAVSPTAPNPAPGQPASPAPIVGESCPLCGAALRPGQEWCLSCGAAARTRLAAAPNWKTPVAALAAVAALALGGLAAALVKLAGETGPGPAPITHTLTTAAPAAVVPPAASTAPTSTVPAPASTVPGRTSQTAPQTAPRTAPKVGATTPPATTPGTGTTTSTGATGTPNSKKAEELNLAGRIGFKR
jgi:hypothetical protein